MNKPKVIPIVQLAFEHANQRQDKNIILILAPHVARNISNSEPYPEEIKKAAKKYMKAIEKQFNIYNSSYLEDVTKTVKSLLRNKQLRSEDIGFLEKVNRKLSFKMHISMANIRHILDLKSVYKKRLDKQ